MSSLSKGINCLQIWPATGAYGHITISRRQIPCESNQILYVKASWDTWLFPLS